MIRDGHAVALWGAPKGPGTSIAISLVDLVRVGLEVVPLAIDMINVCGRPSPSGWQAEALVPDDARGETVRLPGRRRAQAQLSSSLPHDRVDNRQTEADATWTAGAALETPSKAAQDLWWNDGTAVSDLDGMLLLGDLNWSVGGAMREGIVDQVPHHDAEGIDVDRGEQARGALLELKRPVGGQAAPNVLNHNAEGRQQLGRA
jgi:hypothetical protein